jgi:hypothetical protein
MWNWFNCYLSGRHDYGMWCEPGAIFLRCVHCGRRSPGWAVHPGAKTTTATPPVRHPKLRSIQSPAMQTAASAPRVVPFNRSVAT